MMASQAFAVRFSDLTRWDPGSYGGLLWHWPADQLKPIGSVLSKYRLKVDKSAVAFEDLQPITIHFDGSIDRRKVRDGTEYSMELFRAEPGDVVASKIDLKNGAVAVVPHDFNNVVVTSHFAVYRPNLDLIDPEFLLLIIQAPYFKEHLWKNKVGAEGRKEVKLDFFESMLIPVPPIDVQRHVLNSIQVVKDELNSAEADLASIISEFNQTLEERLSSHDASFESIITARGVVADFSLLGAWDIKSARASELRRRVPGLFALREVLEDATELVNPALEPDTLWPVYGVNNKEGVFFSYWQKGSEFRSPYKRIRKDWFFHNPTRSAVGSLGILPEVPDNAITSPEYQVWRIQASPTIIPPGFIAALITTPAFIKLVRIHRVGAVKQRLFTENLLSICVPEFDMETMARIASSRDSALSGIEEANNLLKERTLLAWEVIRGSRDWRSL